MNVNSLNKMAALLLEGIPLFLLLSIVIGLLGVILGVLLYTHQKQSFQKKAGVIVGFSIFLVIIGVMGVAGHLNWLIDSVSIVIRRIRL